CDAFVSPLVLEAQQSGKAKRAPSSTAAARGSAGYRAGRYKRSFYGVHPRQAAAGTAAPAAYTASSRLSAAAGGEGEGETTEGHGSGGGADDDVAIGDDAADVGKKTDVGVLAATATTGAILGSSVVHSLGLGLDTVGAFSGGLAAVGLLAQEGGVGEATAKLGEFVLAAFEVLGTVVASSDVPGKVAGTVGEEILEVVEFTSGAVTKGYLDSLPPPDERYEAEIARSKQTAADLKEQLEKVTSAYAEAKAQLKERAANQRIVDAAKSTAAELAAAKAAVAEKDASIHETLQRAKREKDAFDKDMKAAKADKDRFREMLETRADVDDNFKALAEASDTLEERVQEYESRLRTLTEENDGIRADYTAEIKSMEAERTAMRERISNLEMALNSSEAAIDKQRADLEAELEKMGQALDMKAAAAEEAAALAAEMKAAAQKSLEEKAAAVERAAAEVKAAEADRKAAKAKKPLATEEARPAKAKAGQDAGAKSAEAADKKKGPGVATAEKGRERLEKAVKSPRRRRVGDGHEAASKPKSRATKKAQARPAAGAAAAAPGAAPASPNAKPPPPPPGV
ncbi:unnamed protein product, partial [Scytosiphon promiscuus]